MLCPQCGNQNTYAIPLTLQTDAPAKARARIISADDVGSDHEHRERWRTQDDELDRALGGGFAAASAGVIHGRAGTGKSRVSLRWLTHIGRTLWVTHEMAAPLVVETASSCGARLDNLQIAEDAEPDELADLMRDARATCLGFDSISELDTPAQLRLLRVVRTLSKRPIFALVICHETKAGELRGPTTIEHALDYQLQAHARTDGFVDVEFRKSRYCPRGRATCALGTPSPSNVLTFPAKRKRKPRAT